jgi:formylglycine-generating enzyme required for sulfatase activity
VCVDRYEATVWQIPANQTAIIARVKKGRIRSAAELIAAGAKQVGCHEQPWVGEYGTSYQQWPATFPENGEWTEPMYAISIPGRYPTTCATWYRAYEACAASGKRLISDEEWTHAARIDPATGYSGCNTSGGTIRRTDEGSCVSRVGAANMVGNTWEFVSAGREVSYHLEPNQAQSAFGAVARGHAHNSGVDGSIALFDTCTGHDPAEPDPAETVTYGFRCVTDRK